MEDLFSLSFPWFSLTPISYFYCVLPVLVEPQDKSPWLHKIMSMVQFSCKANYHDMSIQDVNLQFLYYTQHWHDWLWNSDTTLLTLISVKIKQDVKMQRGELLPQSAEIYWRIKRPKSVRWLVIFSGKTPIVSSFRLFYVHSTKAKFAWRLVNWNNFHFKQYLLLPFSVWYKLI